MVAASKIGQKRKKSARTSKCTTAPESPPFWCDSNSGLKRWQRTRAQKKKKKNFRRTGTKGGNF